MRQALLLISCFVAGGWWLSLHPLPEPPPVNVAAGERATVHGCVDSAVRALPEQTRLVLSVHPGARMQVSIYPRPGEDSPTIRYGDRLHVEARIRPPRNFGNPGSFDYERYLQRQQIFWLGTATGNTAVRVEPNSCGHPALTWLHRTRMALLERLSSRYPEESFARSYLPAILFGEDQWLSEDTKEAFRRAGVYHTLVISGQHIAIVAGACLLLLQLAPIPRWLQFLITASICWSYALLSGYETPAVRAACGVTLYLTGALAYRRARPVNLLSVVALVFFAWDPGLILDTGFQLSFLAVLLIAGVAAPLQHRWFGHWPRVARGLGDVSIDLRLPPRVAAARVELRLLAQTLGMASRIPYRWWLRFIQASTQFTGGTGSLLLVSVVVQVGLSLLLIPYFHRVPLLGPLANLLISPLLGLVVPMAFADLAMGIPLLTGALSAMSSLIEQLTLGMAAASPDWRIPAAPSWLLVLCCITLLAAIATCEPLLTRTPRLPRPGKPAPQRNVAPPGRTGVDFVQVRRAGFALAAAAAAVTWIALFAHPFPVKHLPGELELTMIDVGQGESLLIVTPAGRAILVDTGGLGGYSTTASLDTGEDIVAPFLWSRAIRGLHHLVLTHFDFDHAGGAPALLRAFRPGILWTPGMPGEHELGQRIYEEAALQGVPIRQMQRGDRDVVDGVELQVLHPAEWRPASGHSNRQSMVLRLRFGGCSALLTGDLDRSGELRLLADGQDLRADVLKVAHHGSRTSSSALFLDAVNPALGLISVGWLNPFGHPHPTVTARLGERGIATWRTDRQGAIGLCTEGLRWRRCWP